LRIRSIRSGDASGGGLNVGGGGSTRFDGLGPL
jgi:hypothetical protein